MTGGERRSGRSAPSIALPAALAIGSAGPGLLLVEAELAPLAVLWQVAALGACWALARRTAPTAAPRVGTLDGWRAFQRELHRSRRRGYELTLVRVPNVLDDEPGDHPLRAAVNGVLRRTDHVWRHGDDLMVMLPETGGEAARRAVDRIGRVARASSEDGLVTSAPRIASFPEDGLTSSALISAIRGGPAPTRREARPAEAGAGAAGGVAVGPGRAASPMRRGGMPVAAGAVAASGIAFGERGGAAEPIASVDEGTLG